MRARSSIAAVPGAWRLWLALALVLAVLLSGLLVARVDAQSPPPAVTPAPRGDLVVFPNPVQVGQTTRALAYHVIPVNLEVAIEYSEHFARDGESCGGSQGTTPSGSSTLWVTLRACTAGSGYVRLVEAGTRSVIEEVSVTVSEAGSIPRQTANPAITLTGGNSAPAPRGTPVAYDIGITGMDSSKTYRVVVIASEGISFSSSCDYSNYPADFRQELTVDGVSDWEMDYTMYACLGPTGEMSVELWLGQSFVALSEFACCYTSIENPTVRFSSSTYSVREGNSLDITAEISYESFHIGEVQILVTAGTAEALDYTVSGLNSSNQLVFRDLATSRSFTVTANQDSDYDDETVNLAFDLTDADYWLSGTSSPSSSRLTIEDNDTPPTPTPLPNRPPYITGGPTSVSYREDRTDAVGSYTATDPDGDNIAWSLDGGDKSLFTISGGVLTFSTQPNFESPRSNVYNVIVVATDYGSPRRFARRSVVVTVTDYNFPPTVVLQIAAQTVTMGRDTVINLSGKFGDIEDEALRYTAGSSETSVATVSVSGSKLTITPMAAGVARVSVGAHDRGPLLGKSVYQNFAVTVVPAITIATVNDTVTEGTEVRFRLTVTPAVATSLTVCLLVNGGDSFLVGGAPVQSQRITIAGEQVGDEQTGDLVLQTVDDRIDELNEVVHARVLGPANAPANSTCSGYGVGSPDLATVTVKDDDVPPAPTGLIANGHLDRGDVTLRWNEVPGASYEVRYVKEECVTSGVCEPDEDVYGDPDWQTPSSAVVTSGSTVKEARLGGLSAKTLYRVQVRAEIVDISPWSDFAFVHPTTYPRQPVAGPLGSVDLSPPRIATAPLYGYQAKNFLGSNEFSYVVCEDMIPEDLAAVAGSSSQVVADIKAAVGEWEETVKWNLNGVNAITEVNVITTRYVSLGTTPCVPPSGKPIRNQIMFVDDQDMLVALCFLEPLCWRSDTYYLDVIRMAFLEGIGLPTIQPGFIMARESKGSGWYDTQDTDCSVLHTLVMHEVGHALGIGWPGVGDHSSNKMHSVMSLSVNRDMEYCRPQAYDIVAAMANYQSRLR